MKALVYTSPRRVELQDLPRPVPRPGEALVRIRAVGVCGSDLDGFLGRSKKRVPPLVLGHEFSGEIVETGREAGDFHAGDAVAVYPLVTCGDCVYCKTRRHQICPNRKVYGLDFHGALAEYVAAPARCLFRLPKGMTVVEGALVEPLANGIHVVRQCLPLDGRISVVYGAGPIGLMIFWAAKYFGASRVAVVDLNPNRLAILKNFGADLLIDASKQDPVKTVNEWTEGRGVDFAVDAVGRAVCRQNAIASTAPGGTVAWIGLADDASEVDGRAVVTREITVRGSYAYGLDDFAQALSILERGLLRADAFTSETTLDQGQSIFEDLASGQTSIMKAIFRI